MSRAAQPITLTDLVAKHCPLGVQKLCPRCKEEWPADETFFYRNRKTGRLHSWCIACHQECSQECKKRRKAA